MKPWSERKLSSKQIIAELDEKGSEIANVKLELSRPAVPGFGGRGFSTRVLDKTDPTELQAARRSDRGNSCRPSKRKEVKGLFTFYASNYPQAGHQQRHSHAERGVDRKVMDNPSIVVGSIRESKRILFGQFFKVYVQASGVPAVPRGFRKLVRQERS